MTTYTVTRHGLRCDCCATRTPAIWDSPTAAHLWAADALDWADGQPGDLCARCATPEHQPTTCRGGGRT